MLIVNLDPKIKARIECTYCQYQMISVINIYVEQLGPHIDLSKF